MLGEVFTVAGSGNDIAGGVGLGRPGRGRCLSRRISRGFGRRGFGFAGGTGRGFRWNRFFLGVGLVDSLLIAGLLTSFRTINRRCCYYFFLRLLNDGLFDFDDSGIGNGGYYNVGLLLRNLALKYSINMNIVNETVGVNKAGQDYKLSDYLQVKTLSQEESRIGDIPFLRLTDASSGATMRKVRKVILIQPKGASIWDETTGTL